MKKIRVSNKIFSYTSPKNSLVTVVDKKTMEKIQYDLENPNTTSGTVSLDRLLKQIEREKQRT